MCEENAAETAFVAWLVRCGADVSKIDWPVVTPEGQRITVARADVPAEEPVLRVPERCLMTGTACKASEIGELVVKHALYGDTLLATFLLHELRKGAESFWWPYLRILPKDPGSITQWTDEERQALCDRERAVARDRWVEDLYERHFTHQLCALYPDQFPTEDFSLDKFRFAWLVIQSRAFGRRLKETALVPFADCLNHSSDVETSYALADGHFTLFSTQACGYEKGKEVLNSYGPNPNSKLLLDYGFALLDNRHERIRFTLTLDADDALCGRKRALLRRAEMSIFAQVSLERGVVPAVALRFVRVASADETVVAALEAAAEDPCAPCPIAEAELRAYRVLAKHLRKIEASLADPSESETGGGEGGLEAAYDAAYADLAKQQQQQQQQLAHQGGGDNPSTAGDRAARRLSALAYRLTRKRLIASVIDLVDAELIIT